MSNRPQLSLIVIFFNMAREAPRTLHTLSSKYQNVDSELYEVIAIDNGSPEPLGAELVESFGPQFRYIYLEDASPSPANALNYGASIARGQYLGFMIDGARMLSPGVFKFAKAAFDSFSNPVVTTLGFHLGPKSQVESIADGYCQQREDELLASVPWQENGYELFSVAALAGSSKYGWFAPMAESNCLFVNSSLFSDVGGFEESFDLPGGGLVNLDFYFRVCSQKNTHLVQLLGEGSFHQFHGGAMTGKPRDEAHKEFVELQKQYQKIRGHGFSPPVKQPVYLGRTNKSSLGVLKSSLGAIDEYRAENPVASDAFDKVVLDDRFARSDQRSIIVLGMHRSGTSMLTGSLREAGLYLGDVNTHAPHNKKGNMEHPAIMSMQENLLQSNQGSWDEPPASINWDTLHKSIRDLFINSFCGQPVWGFKDPRTLFTIEGWLEELPKAEMVGIFRHPSLVAMSLHARNKFSLEKGLDIWVKYNKRLLSLHRKTEFPLVEFVVDSEMLQEKLEAVVKRLNLPAQYRKLNFFERGLRNATTHEEALPASVQKLYQQLVERSA